MIWLPDVNVLVAAAHKGHPHHAPSLMWINQSIQSAGHLALLTETITGFTRVLALPSAGVQPTDSFRFVDALISTGRASFTRPSHRQLDHFRDIIALPGFRGVHVHDAMIAAAAIDLDATLVTWDSDFSRFPQLRWQRAGDTHPVTNPR